MIAFYISSHGFGHITRCMAIIQCLLRTTRLECYIVCDKSQIDFAKHYLDGYLHRVIFSVQKTDVGLINQEESLSVDILKLEKELGKYIENLHNIIDVEINFLKDKDVQLVISDISILGILVARKLGVKVIGISNFTWYDQYNHLKIKPEISEFFLKAYLDLDYYYQYDLALDCSYLKCPVEKVGLIARQFDDKKISLLQRNNKVSVYISCGRSASLPLINADFKEGTCFYTSGIKVKSNGVALDLGTRIIDTHNYLASCNLALIKAGWSSVAEALLGHTSIIVIERGDVLEDTSIINQLKDRKLCISIKQEELHEIDLKHMLTQVANLMPSNYENNLNAVCEHIINHLQNGHEWKSAGFKKSV